jgi:outer membrane protein TolC
MSKIVLHLRRTRPGDSRAIWIAAALALVCSCVAAPVTAALSLDQALVLARTRSQTLVAQDSAAVAAREMAVAAGQLPVPTLTLGVNNLPINGADAWSLTSDFMTMRSIGVMQEFTREDKRRARTARLEREAESAETGRAAAHANLERDTAIAWLDRYYQEEIRALLVRQRDEARLQIDAAESAYRAGRGSQVDVLSARASVAQVDDRIAQSDRQILNAKTMLARWIGAAAAEPLAPLPATEAVPLARPDLEAQLAHHPSIASLSRQEAMANADADVARTSKLTDWTLALMYSQRGPSYSNMVSINVSIPLQWDQSNRQDREVSAKLALADQARAQREEALRMHVAETEVMWQEWESDRARLVRYDETLIPLAAERTRAALTAYRSGSGMLAAVLDARRNEIDTRIERVRLESEAARLWAQLNYLVPSDDPTRTARR